MLSQIAFLLEATFLENLDRRGIFGKDICLDFRQAKLGEGEFAGFPYHSSHDALAPVGFGQPVADLRPVRFADLQAIESATANHEILLVPDGPLNRLALLLRILPNDL